MREGRAWPGRMAAVTTTEMYPVCSVRDCGRRVYTGGPMCVDCTNMDRELESWSARQKRKSVLRTRVTDLAWIVVLVLGMSALGHYLWPFVWATFELWFGGGQ